MKILFWVWQKYPAPLIPVSKFTESTPWDLNIIFKIITNFDGVMGVLIEMEFVNPGSVEPIPIMSSA